MCRKRREGRPRARSSSPLPSEQLSSGASLMKAHPPQTRHKVQKHLSASGSCSGRSHPFQLITVFLQTTASTLPEMHSSTYTFLNFFFFYISKDVLESQKGDILGSSLARLLFNVIQIAAGKPTESSRRSRLVSAARHSTQPSLLCLLPSPPSPVST